MSIIIFEGAKAFSRLQMIIFIDKETDRYINTAQLLHARYPMGCLFCNIIEGSIPSTKVYENDKVYAFEDIDPKAPVHILVIHKTHTKNIDELTKDNAQIMADLFLAVKEVAALKGIDKDGYRVIINNGTAGGQEVWHLHIHILGGQKMGPMVCSHG